MLSMWKAFKSPNIPIKDNIHSYLVSSFEKQCYFDSFTFLFIKSTENQISSNYQKGSKGQNKLQNSVLLSFDQGHYLLSQQQ